VSRVDRSRPPAPGPVRPFSFPPIRRAKLANGLQVIVAELHRFPVVSVDLVMNAGAVAEADDRSGVATLVTGLLESGTEDFTADQIAERTDDLGLSLETGTGWDTGQIGFSALRARMTEGVELLASLVRRPIFPQAEVDRLSAEQVGTLANRRADPSGLASELFNLYTYAPGTPFARPLGGTAESMGRVTRAEVEEFHAARFRPGGSSLVAAGDVTLEEVVALAERFFGDWSGAAPPVMLPEVKPRLDHAAIIIADRPGAVQSELRIGHLGVERTTPDFIPILVLNTLLGGSFSSRLNMNLRERLAYTYGVSSNWSVRRQQGSFYASTGVQTDVTAHAVAEILGELRRIREAEVTAQELHDASDYLAGVFPLGVETTTGVGARLVSIATYDLPDDYYDSYRERVLAVTAAEILDVARRRIHPERAAIVVAGDAAKIREPLEALGVGPVEVVDAATVLR
jgi:predicted Zn-dependent peptidase